MRVNPNWPRHPRVVQPIHIHDWLGRHKRQRQYQTRRQIRHLWMFAYPILMVAGLFFGVLNLHDPITQLLIRLGL